MMKVIHSLQMKARMQQVPKNLCVLVKYFSKSKKKVEISLLGMADMVSATAENLLEAIASLTDRTHLQLENCSGLGTSSAINMMGQQNSLFNHLKEASPHCILIHCICHSLAISIQNTFDIMYLSVLIHVIPSWFSNSSVKRGTTKHCVLL